MSIHYHNRVLTLSGIRVINKPSGQHIVAIDRVQAHFGLWPLWRGHIRIPHLVIDDPTVELIHAADGTWNMSQQDSKESRPASGGSGFTVEVQDIQLDNGTLIYQDFTLSRHPRILAGAIGLRLSDLSTEKPGPIPVHLTATLRKKRGIKCQRSHPSCPIFLKDGMEGLKCTLGLHSRLCAGNSILSGAISGMVDLRIPSDEQADLLLQSQAGLRASKWAADLPLF